jgi:peptidoglycan hydrolase CwlO-like protein
MSDQPDNIVFEAEHTVPPQTCADAFIATMQEDGFWEKHGEAQPAGLYYGVPIGNVDPVSTAYTPNARPYSPTEDVETPHEEIMSAVQEVSDAISQQDESIRTIEARTIDTQRRVDRLLQENKILGQHIQYIESALLELTACVKKALPAQHE